MFSRPIAVFLVTLLTAFLLITSISIHAVESALTHRLRLSDREVAHVMAIGLSRPNVTLEDAQSLIDAHFALGSYQRIRLLDTEGKALYAREKLFTPTPESKADKRLFWLWTLQPREQLPAANAAVKRNVLGISHVSVQSELTFHHRASEVWLLQLLGIFCGLALSGSALILWHRRRTENALSHLQQGINQMLDARETALPDPALDAFKPVYQATAQMAERIRTRNNKSLEQVETLNRMRRTDPATGLLNRDATGTKLSTLCASLLPSQTGHAHVIRMLNLPTLNTQHGRDRVDNLLAQLGRALSSVSQNAGALDTIFCGRITGTEIVMVSGLEAADLSQTRSRLNAVLTTCAIECRIDDITFGRTERAEDIMRRCELNQSIAQTAETDTQDQRDVWYQRLTWGLSQHHFFLQAYPVVGADGQMVHSEHYLRLAERETGIIHPGGTLMAWAEHLDLAAEIDLEVVNLAFNAAAENNGRICINLSAAALLDPPRRDALITDLQQAPRYCSRIDIDIGEDFAAEHPATLQQFINTVQPMGIRVGIDRLDAHAGSLMQLRDKGVQYVKLAASLTADLIDAQRGRERGRLLSELVHSAHALTMVIFAENVTEPALMKALFELGFDGVSGPAVAL